MSSTLSIQTQNLGVTGAPSGYSPLTPLTPTTPNPSAPLMGTGTEGTPSIYPNLTSPTTSTIAIPTKHVIYKHSAFTTDQKNLLLSWYKNGSIIEMGQLYYNTPLDELPNFTCLLLNVGDSQTHTWLELNLTQLQDKNTYFTIYLYRPGLWESVVDLSTHLLPSVIIKKLDPTIQTGKEWVQSLVKKEIPKIKTGFRAFIHMLATKFN